jgi:hypothetical protein
MSMTATTERLPGKKQCTKQDKSNTPWRIGWETPAIDEILAIENAIVGIGDALTGDRFVRIVAGKQPRRAVPRIVATTELFRWTEIRY